MTEGPNANRPVPADADEQLARLAAEGVMPEQIQWELDSDARVIFAVIQPRRTIADVIPPESVRIGFPFHHAKSLVSQILMHEGYVGRKKTLEEYRAGKITEEARVAGERSSLGKMAAAQRLAEEAQREHAANVAASMAKDTR